MHCQISRIVDKIVKWLRIRVRSRASWRGSLLEPLGDLVGRCRFEKRPLQGSELMMQSPVESRDGKRVGMELKKKRKNKRSMLETL